ncbi:DNA repair helicase XPB [Paenibacillus mucilaginosus]|uniref:DNA 3'-5' helicase n=2 Tax=Paenibacillus mucilaginosus TaxID=61624 RepID=H6NQZ0_9BACL|nr:DNA repair helicase XPB [Paenibacillus mucilaginosus]AEI42429.1 putative ATP-dependent helicase [Paenibacillus mucilaginosus KNP414]AFC31983.1 putative ATP-dependent helicase [Paenibacillus mucilaginosus 3016]MCG7213830.1 DEAD/DEAH box helicase [Paenibacillus mucilaginosus]WDM25839.1 DEAD/DEAH box helicase [Paenibacillus mucilaginosus]WFA20492.1 DEAD/DEAH box helicase [Paenibacillus mucilaginosus]
MQFHKDRPLVIQNDFCILLETRHPSFEEVRAGLSRFADLVKSPENIHTYRMSSLSLWNAAAAGITVEEITDFLERWAKFGIPSAVKTDIRRFVERYGLVRMERTGEDLLLISDDLSVIKEMVMYKSLRSYGLCQVDARTLRFSPKYRGLLKQELIKLGFPVDDQAGYSRGEELPIRLRDGGEESPFSLRAYQRAAVDSFYREGGTQGGSGVLVLPCGAGKTVIGIAAMGKLSCATLILTSNSTSVRQWKREILDKTDVTEDMVGEYTGTQKEVRPITIATYQILTHRKSKDEPFTHMELFNKRDWGLIVYDEVHLLPAPVFRVTADIQATRRLGLTATLIREDGMEQDVFSLVGPKRYEMPWKDLESQGWIAAVECVELRVPLPEREMEAYRSASPREQMRMASINPAKLDLVCRLVEQHKGEQILIIGQYLEQLHDLGSRTGIPVITGSMPSEKREELYDAFRKSAIQELIVSKVANFAVDLPDAAVAIQVSGSYGSRQEEAQRLGRILRPKAGNNKAYFYTVISEDTREQDFALNRQLFLIEQGYRYRMEEGTEREEEVAP